MTDSANAPTALGIPTVEQLTPRLTVERYLNDNIMVYTITGISRQGVQLFFEAARAYIDQQQAANLPVLYLVEIRANVTFTPHFRENSEEFVKQYAHIHGRAAYIFDGGLLLNIVKNFVMIIQSRRQRNITFREFKDKQKALEWLYDGLIAAQASAAEL